jgi:digeranylgeranylglycerophospholipid reductase
MISVIGAGPTGSHAAFLLAREGHDVSLYEEHKEVGKPVQCTGIVTQSIRDVIALPRESVINEVKTARIFSPNNKHLDIHFKRPNLILDRTVFDKALADRAVDAGARLLLGNHFRGFRGGKAVLHHAGRTREKPFDQLIGADGPLSSVAKASGIFGTREFWTGIQATVRMRNDNLVEFYPHIASFAWLVPEDSKTVRIGLLARRHARNEFEQFLRQRAPKSNLLGKQAGVVPLYNPKLRTQKENIFLVGDAATQVKATTGGGLVPGLTAANCLVSAMTGESDYERLWKREVGSSLNLHLRMRRVMDRFEDKDYDRLVGLCFSNRMRSVLATTDRDNLKSLALSMLKLEPRLLSFAKHLIW